MHHLVRSLEDVIVEFLQKCEADSVRCMRLMFITSAFLTRSIFGAQWVVLLVVMVCVCMICDLYAAQGRYIQIDVFFNLYPKASIQLDLFYYLFVD